MEPRGGSGTPAETAGSEWGSGCGWGPRVSPRAPPRTGAALHGTGEHGLTGVTEVGAPHGKPPLRLSLSGWSQPHLC